MGIKFVKQHSLSENDKNEILELWNNEYPKDLNYKTIVEFENYLSKLTEQSHILAKDKNNLIQGWYFDFVRDEQKWFAVILNSKLQGKGIGTKILNLAKEKETELCGWVIDHNNARMKSGSFYKSPLQFYIKNGFTKLSSERLETDKISAVKIKWKNNN